ncbi:MAG: hypothetical protein RIS97_1580 [Pseudomonadota bacterium]|jgi:hypothetical protein
MADSKNEGSKEGFLGRWSQRKQDIRAGKPLAEPEITTKPVALADKASDPSSAQTSEKTAVAEKPEAPLPTMADVHELTAESDFSPFVAKNVSPEVRNSAMKKLFTDPHYNVMDRLDIYIDDYSKPDPIPESMLRQMVSAKFLNLFKAEEEAEAAAEKAALDAKTAQTATLIEAPIGDDAHTVSIQSVAQSDSKNLPPQTTPISTPISGPNDDHSDLRLQQNHAAGPHKLGRGAE